MPFLKSLMAVRMSTILLPFARTWREERVKRDRTSCRQTSQMHRCTSSCLLPTPPTTIATQLPRARCYAHIHAKAAMRTDMQKLLCAQTCKSCYAQTCKSCYAHRHAQALQRPAVRSRAQTRTFRLNSCNLSPTSRSHPPTHPGES